MKTYVVGGAVRDRLLGREPKDVDYVVVGATVDEMIAQGFSMVGSGFPVFLHPETGDEYALARQERKNGTGYYGFSFNFQPDVTLEDDLIRRDLTINSMAMDGDTLVDPYGGYMDLQSKVLRHTSGAFADDPVRVLRTARFAARYHDFTVHPTTIELMKEVAWELDHVPKERIWAEFEKGLCETHAAKMMEVLEQAGAFEVPSLKPYSKWAAYKNMLELPGNLNAQLCAKFSWISQGFGEKDYQKQRVPVEYTKASLAFHRMVPVLLKYSTLTMEDRVDVATSMRVFNNPDQVCVLMEAMRGAAVAYPDLIIGFAAFLKDVTTLTSDEALELAEKAIAMSTSGQEIKSNLRAMRVSLLNTL